MDRGRIERRPVIKGTATAAPLINEGYVSHGPTGTRAVFVWLVEGLSGPEELRLAYAPMVTGIPRYGQWHSILGVPVNRVQADPVTDSPSKARVTVEYGLDVTAGAGDWFTNEPSDEVAAKIEFSSSVREATTELDVYGNPIKVAFYDNLVEDPPPVVEQGGTVRVNVPADLVYFRRREPHSPWAKRQRHLGKINSVPWGGTGALGDFSPHTWMCVMLDGYTDDDQASWNVTYAFQYNAETWDPVVTATDPRTGLRWHQISWTSAPTELPGALRVGDGISQWQVSREADFNALRLFG